MASLALVFLAGSFLALLVEYLVHWALHYYRITVHVNHHKDFFKLSPKEIAERSRCLPTDFKVAGLVLLALSPLMFIWGWVPVLTFFAGMLWHLVIVYETCHFVLHYDGYVPAFIRNTRLFRWWRLCHLAHHFHSPRGNFSVTFPPLDWLLGTYVKPRNDYPEDPSDLFKRKREKKS